MRPAVTPPALTRAALAQAVARLADAGFDLVHQLDLAAVAREPGLERVAADPERRLGVLVGNTRALWPKFRAALRADRELAASSDPLDVYTERTIANAFPDEPAWFGHHTYAATPTAAERTFIPLQRLAELSGLAALAPTHLSIHPIFGPWFALRAIVALRCTTPPPSRAPIVQPCRCANACTSALAAAMSAKGEDGWRAWLAVRDSCSVGREHRYDDDQLAYHYTKDSALLR